MLTSSFSALADDSPLCIFARWNLNFDGFNVSARLHYGPTTREFDAAVKTGYLHAYALYFDVWMRMADRFVRCAALPTLNSALNKKFSSDLLNSFDGGDVDSRPPHPIFVPHNMVNVIVGTTFPFCGCFLT